jgi:hypothetical protein
MAPTRASGSANPPAACLFAAPVKVATVADVVEFSLDVVDVMVIGVPELELEDVVVGGEVEAEVEVEGSLEAEVGEVEVGGVDAGGVDAGGVDAGGVDAGGRTVLKEIVASQSARELPSGQQPALVQ